MNPKCDITTKHVSERDIEEVFDRGPKFKITNTQLHANTRKKLLNLCNKIYGSSNVMNNEFMSWVMKGYVQEVKGFDIKWARMAALIAKEKACRVAAKKMRSNKSSYVSKLSGGEISCKTEGDVVCKSFVVLEDIRSKATICPYGIPLGEVAKVQDLVCFLNELFKNLEQKVVILEGKARKLFERLIGLWYNMDDHKVVAAKAQECFDLFKSRQQNLINQATLLK
jgi:hypothetical protein